MMPTWLNGGCATGSPNAQGELEVTRIPFNDKGTSRLLHAASGARQFSVGVAVCSPPCTSTCVAKGRVGGVQGEG